MEPVRTYGTTKKIKKLLELSKQALREGAYRVATHAHGIALNMEGKTAPKNTRLLKVHRSKVSIWLRSHQEHGTEGILEGHRSGGSARMSNRDCRRLSDILDGGPAA